MHALLRFFSATASKTEVLLQEPTVDVTPTSYIREKKSLYKSCLAQGGQRGTLPAGKPAHSAGAGTATGAFTRRADKRARPRQQNDCTYFNLSTTYCFFFCGNSLHSATHIYVPKYFPEKTSTWPICPKQRSQEHTGVVHFITVLRPGRLQGAVRLWKDRQTQAELAHSPGWANAGHALLLWELQSGYTKLRPSCFSFPAQPVHSNQNELKLRDFAPL